MKKLFASLLILTALVAAACTPVFAASDQITAVQQGVSYSEIVGATPATGSIQEVGWMPVRHFNAQGDLIWAGIAFNALANEGEYLIEDVMFRGATAPTGYFLRLYNTTPALTSTLSTLAASEAATANGYAPASQGITKDSTGWPLVPQLVSSHYEITSKTVTITATGAIGPVIYAALSTTSDNTGKLVAYAALAATRTLASGDSLQITYKIRLQ
jgi:hypothetical protein